MAAGILDGQYGLYPECILGAITNTCVTTQVYRTKVMKNFATVMGKSAEDKCKYVTVYFNVNCSTIHFRGYAVNSHEGIRDILGLRNGG